MANKMKYFIKSDNRKYLKLRERGSNKKYSWGEKSEVIYFNTREQARSVARRYGGRIVCSA